MIVNFSPRKICFVPQISDPAVGEHLQAIALAGAHTAIVDSKGRGRGMLQLAADFIVF